MNLFRGNLAGEISDVGTLLSWEESKQYIYVQVSV